MTDFNDLRRLSAEKWEDMYFYVSSRSGTPFTNVV